MKALLDSQNLKAQIVFAQNTHEEETFHQNDLVQLFPYGLSVTTDATRPFLLLKDEAHVYTLPVAVSPIDAGVALSQNNKVVAESSPHKFTALLLQSLGIEIKQAVFVEIKGSHQYVRLYISGHPATNSVKLRADEAMSLCLYLQVPLFATKNFIGRSRILNAEIESGAQKAQNFGFMDKGFGYLN
ncbi:bifunctional nuclease family protein [Bdellovibrio bacteriovorus]|uniref:bifunctional nuclease family protein n=1 Tax=Bdellovibrio bacteriovorus TaxID=959 RepID=UPI0035A61A19